MFILWVCSILNFFPISLHHFWASILMDVVILVISFWCHYCEDREGGRGRSVLLYYLRILLECLSKSMNVYCLSSLRSYENLSYMEWTIIYFPYSKILPLTFHGWKSKISQWFRNSSRADNQPTWRAASLQLIID